MTFEEQKKRAKEHARKVKEKQQIYKLKHANDSKDKRLPTHKLITFYLFALLNVILIFARVAMWHFGDLTNLGVIITDIAAQVLTFLIYSHHSTAQNTTGGIIYDVAMEQIKSRFHKKEEMTEKEKEEAVG